MIPVENGGSEISSDKYVEYELMQGGKPRDSLYLKDKVDNTNVPLSMLRKTGWLKSRRFQIG